MAIENPNVIQGGTIGIEAKCLLDGAIKSVVTWPIPPRIGVISIGVRLPAEAGNSYKVEYSNSLVVDVQADTAVWFDAYGANQSTSRIIAVYGALSAVRVTRLGGVGTFVANIRGQ